MDVEKFLKLGKSIYETGGLTLTLLFMVAFLVFIMLSYLAKALKKQSNEILMAREEVDKVRKKMHQKVEDDLDDCNRHRRRDQEIIAELHLTIAKHCEREKDFLTEISCVRSTLTQLKGVINELQQAPENDSRR